MQDLRKFFAGVVDAFVTLDAARATVGRPAPRRSPRRVAVDPAAFLTIGLG